MKRIDSFTIDHTRLNKGLYVSRTDQVGAETLTTFDLRMKVPNREILDNGAVHTLEHLIATYLRNDRDLGGEIVYFGPMGCLTGMYLIVRGKYESREILPFVLQAFRFAAEYQGDIPGVSEVECGTYKLHNLEGARAEALAYLNVLDHADDRNLTYPS